MRAWLPAVAAVSAVLAAVLAVSFAPSGSAAVAAPRKLSSYDAQAKALLGTMTLDEKIGQMVQAEQDKLTDEKDVETYFLGSVLSGGDSDPKTNSLQDWTDVYDRFQSRALKTRLKIPILYGVDAVHGHNNVIGAVVFPHHIGLGATRDAKLVREIGRVTAEEVRATGIQWAFAPCVAVVRDQRWGRTYESFSEEPSLVAELGEAEVAGLQGDDLKDPLRVLACAKHYVGDGGTAFGSGTVGDWRYPGRMFPIDQGDTRVSEAELRRIHLPGYVKTVAAGVGTIMPSYSSWNGARLSGHKYLLTDLLKSELGFDGFLISDYNAIDALPGDYRNKIKLSASAGMDMFMVPQKYKELYADLKDLAEKGEVPMSRIDDAVLRILRVKFALGLFEPGRSQLADRRLHERFGSPDHRALARRAVRESLVLLKNDRRALPLSKTAKRIVVAGKNADDLGNQCGGWTITWQGKGGEPTKGTTILAALRSAAGKGTEVAYSKDGSGAAGTDAGVVVVGETPYAEMLGDREDLALAKEDLGAIANVKEAGIPLVVVVVSGRPLILGDGLDMADALVAAWLPGSEGAGVADVLFGDYKPTGKLSFSWPRSTAQIPINVGDAKYDPQFPFGFGLTY
ncbi:MAG TPA: glycoside hydrolase family 3 N-terminal domain-containing protein [Gemmatimonadales bacterium]|nr:glycoside hydrolase family 3 N-terminal domain-containing protein [Gemmatimonadales bacterium]